MATLDQRKKLSFFDALIAASPAKKRVPTPTPSPSQPLDEPIYTPTNDPGDSGRTPSGESSAERIVGNAGAVDGGLGGVDGREVRGAGKDQPRVEPDRVSGAGDHSSEARADGGAGGTDDARVITEAERELRQFGSESAERLRARVAETAAMLEEFRAVVAPGVGPDDRPTAPDAQRRKLNVQAWHMGSDQTAAEIGWKIFKVRVADQGLNDEMADSIRAEFLQPAMDEVVASRRALTEQWESTDSGLSVNERDFSYGPSTTLAPRGRVARLNANLAAINLLKTLEVEDRLATPAEKAVLAAYNGFGADKEVLNTTMAGYRTFTDRNQYAFYIAWENTYGEWYNSFRAVLTEEEWRAAETSTLNSHFTAEPICHALWDAGRRLGFRGGKIVESTCGTGNLLGAMPANIRNLSEVTGVELDSITARIAQRLYPQARIENIALQDAQTVGRNVFDFALTNVPFSDIEPANQRFPVKLNLHNYCIARNMNALKPGGVAVLITSASTMENNGKQRDFLASRCELLGAIRLPNSAFQGNANTEVVTDILFLRKPDGKVRMGESWTAVLPLEIEPDQQPDSGRKVATVNEYFHRHPEMVIGQHSLKGKMYGGGGDDGQYTVVFAGEEADLMKRLSEAIQTLPENVFELIQDQNTDEEAQVEQLNSYLGEKEGNIVVRDNRLYLVGSINEDGHRPLSSTPWWDTDYKLPRRMKVEQCDDMARDYVEVRESLKALIGNDLNPLADDDASALCRERLNTSYDAFTLHWGKLNDSTALVRLLENDPDFGSVMALEVGHTVEIEGQKAKKLVHEKAAIFTQRTVYPISIPDRANTVSDAITISLNIKGRIEEAYVAQLLGVAHDVTGVRKLILDTGTAFEDPDSGRLVTKTEYLVGNVVGKLTRAMAAAESEPRFGTNVKALEEIQPEFVPFEHITAVFGAAWLPPELVGEFVAQICDRSDKVEAHYLRAARKWYLLPAKLQWSGTALATYGTPRVGLDQILNAAIGQQQVKVYDTIGDNQIYNPKESAKANERVAAIHTAWQAYLKQNEDRQKLIERSFNDHFNQVREPVYSGDHLTFPGLATGAGALDPRSHQRDATARALAEQAGTLAHAVGYGKTLSLALIAYESKRTGLANKPVIVCDNASYAQFVATVRQCYPQATLLCTTKDSINEKNRDRFLAQAATGNWDIILMAQSHFDRIPNSPATEVKHINRQLEELRRTKEELSRLSGKKQLERQVAKALASEEQKLLTRMRKLRDRGDDCFYWEQIGCDLLLVDEVHKYKKLPFATNHRNVKGIDTTKSQRGERLLMKAMEIQERRDGKGVITASGTPVTNTMAEAWNMIRLSNPKVLEQFSVTTFDEFVSFCCQKVVGMELNESNMKWRNVERLAKFFNGPSFVHFVRTGMDVKMDASVVKLDVPLLKGGQIELKVIEQTDSVAELLEGISEVYDAYEKSNRKADLSFVPIMLMQVGMAASIDPRLIDASAPDEPESLVNQAIEELLAIYHETSGQRSTQAIFLDRFNTMDTSALNALRKGNLDGLKAEYEDADLPTDTVVEGETPEVPQEKEAGRWNLYAEIKQKLIARGIPAKEIAFVSDAKDDEARKTMFEAVNTGEIRIIGGSTQRLGTGVNIQRKLIAVHHLDPARDLTPASMTQRNGRIVRQGNENKEVRVIYYGMKDTVTPGVYHRLQRKDGFIAQVFANRGIGMEFEDAGEIRLEEMKASLISDKRQLRRAEMIAEIRELRLRAEMAQDRERALINSARMSERRLETYLTRSLPRALSTAKWMAANVTPVDVFLETEAVTIRLPGEVVPTALPLKEATKRITAKIAEWKRERLNGAVKQLGSIEINGLRMTVRKELAAIDTEETRLIVEVPHPEVRGFTLGEPMKFATPEALYRVLRARFDEVNREPESVKASIAEIERDVAGIREQLDQVQRPDLTRIAGLITELEELEKDMRENPAKRRSSRRVNAPDDAGETPEIIPNPSEEPPRPVLRFGTGTAL